LNEIASKEENSTFVKIKDTSVAKINVKNTEVTAETQCHHNSLTSHPEK
jgi:hypothetical protein